MATDETLRQLALRLPGAYEDDHRGGPAFRVKGKKFALWWAQGQRVIMKLPPHQQEFLFAHRPEIFAPCRVGRVNWSFVELAHLDDAELADLVSEAWSTVAPKSLSRPRQGAKTGRR